MEAQPQQKPEIFEGNYRKEMPHLIAMGLKPATVGDIMELGLLEELSSHFYCCTSSGIAYAGNNRDKFKIIPYSQNLAQTTPETNIYSLRISLTPEQYDKIPEEELTREDMIIGRGLKEQEVLEHSGWLKLAGNRELLENYTERVFRSIQQFLHGEKGAMGFYIGSPKEVSTPNLRLFLLEGVRSDVYDIRFLYGDARLVGLQP